MTTRRTLPDRQVHLLRIANLRTSRTDESRTAVSATQHSVRNIWPHAAIAVVASCALGGAAASAQVTNYETKGNQQSLSPVGCVDVPSVSRQNTPADIYPGVRKCIEAKDYVRGARLFAVAGVYGRFDTLRVLDESAHAAVPALQYLSFAQIDEAVSAEFRATVKVSFAPGSRELADLCKQIRTLGPPAYAPTYMTQHGLSAITGTGGGLKADFNPSQAWESALTGYLNCP